MPQAGGGAGVAVGGRSSSILWKNVDEFCLTFLARAGWASLSADPICFSIVSRRLAEHVAKSNRLVPNLHPDHSRLVNERVMLTHVRTAQPASRGIAAELVLELP